MNEPPKALQPEGEPAARPDSPRPLELLKKAESKKKRKEARRAVHPTEDTMNGDVKAFVEMLEAKYPERFRHRAKQAKARVITLVKLHLRPYPKRSGRPKDPRITEALQLKRQQERQVREGKRKTLSWIGIARKCISNFDDMSKWRRAGELRRLQNATKQRESRERKRKEGTLPARSLTFGTTKVPPNP